MTHRLYVCSTCPRYEPRPAGGAPTRGRQLADALRAALATLPEAERPELRVVPCLSGCPNPCNIALEAPGKTRLRFARFGPDDAQSVLEALALYGASADGELQDAALPAALRGRITSRIPAALSR